MDNKELLNFKEIGNGYPVVFLHGYLESIEMWDYFNFDNSFRCILIDLPGHGNSKYESNSPISMLSMAENVIEIINHLRLKKYALVGHSMGGYIGLELKNLDTRCDKLVLLNSNFWEDSELKKKDRKRVAQIVQKNKDLFLYEAIPNLFSHPEKFNLEIRKIIDIAKQMSPDAIGQISIAMSKRNSFESKLESIKSHLLIIQGKEDSIVPLEKMEEALVEFPEIHFDVIDSGHMSHIENTLTTQKKIENFLIES